MRVWEQIGRVGVLAAVVGASVGLAACGPDSSSGASKPAAVESGKDYPAGDPCGLVTVDEMSEALGVTITDTRATGWVCEYAIDPSGTATVEVLNEGGPDRVEGAREGSKAPVDIPGVGDDAVYAPLDQTHTGIYVAKGDTAISLNLMDLLDSATTLPAPNPQEGLTKVARLVVDRV